LHGDETNLLGLLTKPFRIGHSIRVPTQKRSDFSIVQRVEIQNFELLPWSNRAKSFLIDRGEPIGFAARQSEPRASRLVEFPDHRVQRLSQQDEGVEVRPIGKGA
jgi:hypothetical protein